MRRQFHALLLGCLTFAAACGDSSGPSPSNDPAGSYIATRFLTTFNGVTTDQLSEGVTVSITLTADGMTSGLLSVPAASDVPLSLAGTWSQQRDTVSFHGGSIETFLQRLPFRLTSGALEGDGLVGAGRIQITLRRGPGRPNPTRLIEPRD